MEKVENNKIIADWMGWNKDSYGRPCFNGQCVLSERDYKFHSDWNWFMSAWFKWSKITVPERLEIDRVIITAKIQRALFGNDTPLEASRVLADGVRWMKSIENKK